MLSAAAFLLLLLTTCLLDLPPEANVLWNGTWLLTNFGIGLAVIFRGSPGCGVRRLDSGGWTGVLLFAVAYGAFFAGATRVVPPMDDHDYEAQGTGFGLLARLEPALLTDQ